jgi:hypothetical protein
MLTRMMTGCVCLIYRVLAISADLQAGKLYSIGGNVYGSDLRLKTDVSSLDRMVDKILALRGVRFKWRTAGDEDSYRIGLIAQEVERVLPEVIETGSDGMKGINEAGLIAAIITAIKDQQAELSALRPNLSSFRVHSRKKIRKRSARQRGCSLTIKASRLSRREKD